MILGIGIDLVAVARMERLWNRYGQRLAARLLSVEEQQELENHPAWGATAGRDSWAARFLAKRFAAKEAFAKAWGSGIGQQLAFHDLTVAHHPSGQPYWRFSPRFTALWLARRADHAHLSLSDEQEQVVAVVVIEGRGDGH